MARTVHAGAKGVDVSFARPPGQRLVDLGYTFGVGYLSVPPASPGKNLTKAECLNYLLYIFLLLVWEMTAGRANLGALYGTQDGFNAAKLAAQRGAPTDVPILVADDTNTTPQNVTAQEAYMRAFAKACAPYPIGIYGDVDILYRCADLWVIGWLPNAWSWSGGSRAIAEATARALGVHVLQHTGYYIDGTWAVDPDECIRPFPAWGLGSDPQPVVEDDMDVVTNAEQLTPTDPPLTVKFAVAYRGQSLYHLSGPEWAAGGSKDGVALSNTDLDAIAAIPMPTTPAPTFDIDALATAIAAKIPPATFPANLVLDGNFQGGAFTGTVHT